MAGEGTWIDWQYLWDSAKLLKRCRYTLQYTYPYAYYMEVGPRKELFEYQQVSNTLVTLHDICRSVTKL